MRQHGARERARASNLGQSQGLALAGNKLKRNTTHFLFSGGLDFQKILEDLSAWLFREQEEEESSVSNTT